MNPNQPQDPQQSFVPSPYSAAPQQPSAAPPPNGRPSCWASPVVIIISLLFCFPVGLYLMWAHTGWNKNLKWVITGILALFTFGTIVAGAIQANSPEGRREAAQQAAAQKLQDVNAAAAEKVQDAKDAAAAKAQSANEAAEAQQEAAAAASAAKNQAHDERQAANDANLTDIGSQGYLRRDDATVVPVAVSLDAFNALGKASLANDDVGIQQLYQQNQCALVPNDTQALLIDIHVWDGCFEVRLKSGPLADQVVFVDSSLLRKGP